MSLDTSNESNVLEYNVFVLNDFNGPSNEFIARDVGVDDLLPG